MDGEGKGRVSVSGQRGCERKKKSVSREDGYTSTRRGGLGMPKNSDGTAPGTARAGHHDGDRAGLGPSRVVHVPWGENRPVAAAKNARRSPSATSPSSRSEAFVLVSPRRVTASASRGIAAGALSERGDAPRPRPPLFVRLWVPRSATAVATVAPVTVASGDTMPTDVLSAFSLSIDCQNRPELGGRSPAFACAEEARETRACGSPTRESRTECSVRRVPCVRARAFVCASSPEGPKGTCKKPQSGRGRKSRDKAKSARLSEISWFFSGFARSSSLCNHLLFLRANQDIGADSLSSISATFGVKIRIRSSPVTICPYELSLGNSLHVCESSAWIDRT